jgi:hypothetical protein
MLLHLLLLLLLLLLLRSCKQISGAHAIGVTAVSWAPAVPAGGMVSSAPPAAPVKRLCTAGCDNTVKVRASFGSGNSSEE